MGKGREGVSGTLRRRVDPDLERSQEFSWLFFG
jgi:hypothetical protein